MCGCWRQRGHATHSPEKPERRGREWEMPVFRNASLPVEREVLAIKAENGPRDKQLLCRLSLKTVVGGTTSAKADQVN